MAPDRPQALLHQAHQAFESGALSRADKRIRELLRIAPRWAPALHLAGLVALARRDVDVAIEHLRAATSLAPGELLVWVNFGNAQLEKSAWKDAEDAFRRALALNPAFVPARGLLAQALEEQGDLDGARRELEAILAVAPHELEALVSLARVLRRARAHEQEVVAVRRALGLDPGNESLRRALGRAYFLWFDSVDRDKERAGRVLAEWLAFEPDDPVAQHMRAALGASAPPPRASDGYVERHFDEFAASFDEVLSGLAYCGPELCRQLLGKLVPEGRKLDVLDLGCGTGRCGQELSPWVRRIVGVDLSSKMLETAQRRGIYDALVREELSAYLVREEDVYDLAVAADTLIYFGEVHPLLRSVARVVKPGGWCIATIELCADDVSAGHRLLESGRYAHSERAIRAWLDDAGWTLVAQLEATLRVEYGVPVRGMVFAAERR